MRLFYAAYLSRENMEAYQALVDRLIEGAPSVLRSVPHRSHHLTLAFLGEIGEVDLDRCSDALGTLEELEAFPLTLGPPGLLMGRGRPRLIRVGITSGEDLVHRVQTSLISYVTDAIPTLDTRSKPPHITLARFNKSAGKAQTRAIRSALETQTASLLPTRDQFSTVQLVKSSLSPSGPIYETLREVRLSGRS